MILVLVRLEDNLNRKSLDDFFFALAMAFSGGRRLNSGPVAPRDRNDTGNA